MKQNVKYFLMSDDTAIGHFLNGFYYGYAPVINKESYIKDNKVFKISSDTLEGEIQGSKYVRLKDSHVFNIVEDNT